MASFMTANERETFARRVRVEMAKRGLSRGGLAVAAGCKERTIGNVLAGQAVRDATITSVAHALAIEVDDLVTKATRPNSAVMSDGRADEAYGGYLLAAFEDYLGTYVAYRRVFEAGGNLMRSVYEIDWDEDLRRLRFLELQRLTGRASSSTSGQHGGGVYISPLTGMIQFLTTFQGALRLVTLDRFRRGEGKLRGVILTQSDRERFYQPAVSAIFLEKIAGRQRHSDLEKKIGIIGPQEDAYVPALSEIEEIERRVIYLAGPDKPRF